MVFRVTVLAVLAFGIFAYVKRAATTRRKNAVLRLLRKQRRSVSFAALSRALHHPPWLAPVLSHLAGDGQVLVEVPETFRGDTPREEQVLYQMSKVRPRGF